MDITVLICTRNRSNSLKDTLECLCAQQHTESITHEVIVVDNGSTDWTSVTVEAYKPRFKGALRYLYEARKGKPYAINTGIAAAKGAIIAMTDDDCLPAPDYLLRLKESFHTAGEDVMYLGGKIHLDWQNQQRPGWLSDYFLANLARLDYGDEPFVIDGIKEKRDVFGANFAFRRDAFRRYGGFALEKTYTQDIEMIRRILSGGGKGYYAPSVRVGHKVSKDRLQKHYFYRWYFRRGRMRVYDPDIIVKKIHPLGVPLWICVKSLKSMVKSLIYRYVYRRESEAVRNFCDFLMGVGFICEQSKRHLI